MITYLFVWVCTSAAMDDCLVFAADAWEGPAAPIECERALPRKQAELRRELPDGHTRAFCDSGSQGE